MVILNGATVNPIDSRAEGEKMRDEKKVGQRKIPRECSKKEDGNRQVKKIGIFKQKFKMAA